MKRSVHYALAACMAFSLPVAAQAAPQRVVLPNNVVPVSYDLMITPQVKNKTFRGQIAITLKVKTPTNTVSFNAADLKFSGISMAGSGNAPKQSYDEKTQTETLHFATKLKPGEHVLKIAYSGKINDSAAGLFALAYDDHGKKQVGLYTQFENSDARRFMPCWDEPGRKAVFRLSAILPANQMAVSNMPVESSQKIRDGYKLVHFAATPKMSSYLLFYAQGDFERIHHDVDGTDVGVIVKRGDTAKARYALKTASEVLPYYNKYFGLKYPLPKLDLIAAPGRSQFFSAMENWGAIFYFERAVLFDPATSTENDKRRVFITISHEMSHQWFGDLVTMAWWDELWLNEGFASWMENKATDHFNPQWHVWRNAMNAVDYAMAIDSKPGTHPIIQNIVDVNQASQAFDTITYIKGRSVIRMLESYMGSKAFRDGVRIYMKQHAYGNTVSDDMWAALSRTTSLPVTQIAHDFTLNPGVPLVTAKAAPHGLSLSVSRFYASGSKPSDINWHVPVTISDVHGKVIWRGTVTPAAAVTVPVPAQAIAVINPGRTGYYRVQYGPKLAAKLAGRFSYLAPMDQLGLMANAMALGTSGDQPLSAALILAGAVNTNFDPQVQIKAASVFGTLDTLSRGTDEQSLIRAYALKHLKPMLSVVGWKAKAGESGNVAQLRSTLIQDLGHFGDEDVLHKARMLFEDYRKNPATLSGNMRSAVLQIVAEKADVHTWNQLHRLARNADSAMDKERTYILLGTVENKNLAERTLALTLNGEVPVTIRPSMVAAVARHDPALAFAFAMKHKKVMDGWLESSSRDQYYANLVRAAHNPEMIDKVKAYTEKYVPAPDRASETRVIAGIAHTISVREKYLPALIQWLQAHPVK